MNPLQVRAVFGLAVLAVFALLLGTVACGGEGDDADDAKQAVRDFVEATNARDGDRLCGDLLTREYIERATGATGDAAQQTCKRQLDLLTGLRLKLVSVGAATVDGDEATVRAVIVTGGQRTRRVFRLAKEDGDWKLLEGRAENQ